MSKQSVETRCLHHFYHNVTSCFISENDQFCNQSKHNYFEQSLNGNLWKGPKLWNGFSSNSIDLFFSFWSFGFMWKESSDVNTTRTRVHRKSFVIFHNEIIFPKRLRTFHFFSLFLCWGPLTGAPRVPGAPEGPAGPDSPWKAKNRQTRFAADLGSKVNILTFLHRLKLKN